MTSTYAFQIITVPNDLAYIAVLSKRQKVPEPLINGVKIKFVAEIVIVIFSTWKIAYTVSTVLQFVSKTLHIFYYYLHKSEFRGRNSMHGQPNLFAFG